MTTVGTGEWLGGCPSLSGVLALSGVRASLHGSQRPGYSALRFTWASRTPATFSRAHAHARKTDVPYLGVRIVCGRVGHPCQRKAISFLEPGTGSPPVQSDREGLRS